MGEYVNPKEQNQNKPQNTSQPRDNRQRQQKTPHQNQERRRDYAPAGNDYKKFISLVIPLYNEEESIIELSFHLEEELERIARNNYEVIFIDDGSTDKSFESLKQINRRNRNFKAIRFRRNYGKSEALSAGFNAAKGNIIITMDADLQDDPSEIPALINKIKEGYDLVSGWKKVRKDPITKTIPSKIFNWVTSITCGLKLHDYNCGLKAYRREVAKRLQVYGEMHRYIPALAHWEGFKITEIPVKHHARQFGKSKYGFSRLIKGYLDLLTVLFTTRYLKRPLHFFGTLGSLGTLAGLAINIYLTIEWLLGRTYLSNRPLALFGIALIIVGIQFISIGLLGEMLVKNSMKNINYNISEKL
ncbi:MAG: hypothetical protein QG635_1298 [Bacteroidota bacterium]|nr:hypothetical protein [Bacteroidota bacterium]